MFLFTKIHNDTIKLVFVNMNVQIYEYISYKFCSGNFGTFLGVNVFEKNMYVQIYENISYKFCSGNFGTPFGYKWFRKKYICTNI